MAADSGGTHTGDVAGAASGRDVDPSELLILSHCVQGLKATYLDRFPGGDPAQIRAWGEPMLERRYHRAGKIAVHELGRWIDTLPEPSWIDPRELFFMELKTGAWLPMKYLALDSVVQVMSLGNCRSFHSQGFAQTATLRSAPHYLMRAILRHLWPDVPDLPFNALL